MAMLNNQMVFLGFSLLTVTNHSTTPPCIGIESREISGELSHERARFKNSTNITTLPGLETLKNHWNKNYFTSSDPHHDIYTFNIFWHSIWYIFWHSIWHSLCHSLWPQKKYTLKQPSTGRLAKAISGVLGAIKRCNCRWHSSGLVTKMVENDGVILLWTIRYIYMLKQHIIYIPPDRKPFP